MCEHEVQVIRNCRHRSRKHLYLLLYYSPTCKDLLGITQVERKKKKVIYCWNYQSQKMSRCQDLFKALSFPGHVLFPYSSQLFRIVSSHAWLNITDSVCIYCCFNTTPSSPSPDVLDNPTLHRLIVMGK